MNKVIKLEQKMESLKKEREDLWVQMKPLNEKVSSITSEIKTTFEEFTKEKLKTNMSEQERFDFIMEENGCSLGQLRYKVASDFIRELGLYMTGYSPFSEQKRVAFFIYKFDNNANTKTIASLKKLASLCKPMNENGEKFFEVFCKDMHFVAYSDGSWSFRGSRNEEKFPSLEELFEYYISYHPCHDDDDHDSDD